MQLGIRQIGATFGFWLHQVESSLLAMEQPIWYNTYYIYSTIYYLVFLPTQIISTCCLCSKCKLNLSESKELELADFSLIWTPWQSLFLFVSLLLAYFSRDEIVISSLWVVNWILAEKCPPPCSQWGIEVFHCCELNQETLISICLPLGFLQGSEHLIIRMFEHGYEESKGEVCVLWIWKTSSLGRGNSKCKGSMVRKSLRWMTEYKEAYGLRRPAWLVWLSKEYLVQGEIRSFRTLY